MTWLLDIWHDLLYWLPALLVGLHFVFISATILWILMSKAESQSAVAWCLIVFFVPYLGALFFLLFGYQHVHRPLRRKRQHIYLRNSAPRRSLTRSRIGIVARRRIDIKGARLRLCTGR